MADEIKQEDVKKDQDTSTDTSVKDSTDTVKTEESDGTFVEEAKRTIPYARFKEKAAESKELKREIEKLKAEGDKALKDLASQYQTYYEGEISKIKREKTPDDEDLSYYEEPKPEKHYEEKINPLMEQIKTLQGEISAIKSENETTKLKTQITGLKEVYPELDEEHVFAVKKLKPDWSLDECAEYSHKHFEETLKEKWQRMLNEKKAAAKKPIMTSEGKFNIKPEEMPKSFAEAKKRMIEYAKQLDL